MTNGLDEAVDPTNPASVIRWTARAAAAFETIRRDQSEMKAGQADLRAAFDEARQATAEHRTSVDERLRAGAATFADHARRLDGLDTVMAEAVAQMVGSKPKQNGRADIDSKWVLEKVALPLLMSGTGASVALLVARAMGTFH
jgi:hypothetical protein